MSGNSFGQQFVLTTAGESHGPMYIAIVDGCPPGMKLSEDDIQPALDKRRPGYSDLTSARKEADQIEIVAGVFEGKTTGTPIGLLVRNEDQRSQDYEAIKSSIRPGHADYSYYHKYGIRDHRGGGRASARETVMRVAAGAIAAKYLKQKLGVEVVAYLAAIADVECQFIDESIISSNPFYCADPNKLSALELVVNKAREQGDSVGARINIVARNVPCGLGEPVFDKLDADIAKAMMSINAVKGVEIGSGFSCVNQKGSEHRDALNKSGFVSNYAGGTLGGISSGQEIVVSIALKPTSSIAKAINTLDIDEQPVALTIKGRHDPCVGIRAVAIAEAMLSLTLMDHYLRWRAQCG